MKRQTLQTKNNVQCIKNGVATQIANEEKRAVFIHSYGHALNHTIGDAVKNSSILQDTLDIAYEISKLI